jgi:hypothetical protein
MKDGIYVNFAPMSRSSPSSPSSPAPSPSRHSAKLVGLLRVVWVAPVSVFALPLLPLALWRAQWRWVNGVLEISSPALAWFLRGPWFRALSGGVGGAGGLGFSAATIGHVIVARDQSCLDSCRTHEHVHVRQSERWGPLFPLAYIAAGLMAAWRERRWSAYYWDNPFEQEARAAETAGPELPR